MPWPAHTCPSPDRAFGHKCRNESRLCHAIRITGPPCHFTGGAFGPFALTNVVHRTESELRHVIPTAPVCPSSAGASSPAKEPARNPRSPSAPTHSFPRVAHLTRPKRNRFPILPEFVTKISRMTPAAVARAQMRHRASCEAARMESPPSAPGVRSSTPHRVHSPPRRP